MKRVALLTTSYPRFAGDEAGIFIARLAEGYRAIGSSGVVIVPRDATEPATAKEGTFELHRYRYWLFTKGVLAFGSGIMPNLRAYPLAAAQIPMLLAGMWWRAFRTRHLYDFIHANWLATGVVAWALAVVTGRPYLLSLRGEDVRLLRYRAVRVLLGPALQRARAITTVNIAFAEEVRKLLPHLNPAKVITVPNGVATREVSSQEIQTLRDELRLSHSGPCLFFAGTITRRKNIEGLIRMVESPELRNATLLLGGRCEDTAYLNELTAIARNGGSADRVRFLGAIAPEKVWTFLAVSDAYVTCSQFEGRPNSVLEAMAAGVMVVASDIDAHRELLHPNRGILFPLATPEEGAQALARALANSSYSNENRINAQLFVKELSWEGAAMRFLQLAGEEIVSESTANATSR